MVFLDSSINIYVDFLPITATASPEEALALLISMYTIFELNFPKNNRTMRLLYAVLHADTRFLPNAIRHFMKEKQIDIFDPYRQNHPNISTAGNNESQLSAEYAQSSNGEDKSSESASSSTGNPSTDNVCSATTVSQIARNSPLQSYLQEDQ
jgi:hypothetical protein